ncbi:glycosyltransferase family 2 protein [Microbulbifer agarilyticus]|uniref:glycosyltransferase family 2 protein n=1 Tax=Microbulbifer agarilyticus TaxID=260552 RepID=UPI001CD480DA|nr:glycosyltransferase family 2 protein [Microbulbifer agarilyticus]MCA0893705.1 glycosyltransferase family 2 protein [Microbulbifer agarilyticus]
MLRKIRNTFRPLKTPKFCIDQSTSSHYGITVTGWFASNKLRSISLVNEDQIEQLCSIETYPREDVNASLGFQATGFNIHCGSVNEVNGLYISLLSKRGNQRLYPVMGETNSEDLPQPIEDPLEDVVKSDLHDSQGHVDFALQSDNIIFLSGWLASKAPYKSIELVQNNEVISRIEDAVIWTQRTDVENALKEKFASNECRGFITSITYGEGQVKLDSKNLGIRIQLGDHSIELPVQNINLLLENQKHSVIKTLNGWNPLDQNHIARVSDVIQPILSQLYRHDTNVSCSRVDYGSRHASPKSSIIIPLYGRFDFLRYQVSRFNRQQNLKNHEVIFVVDDPNIEEAVIKLAEEVYDTFQFPFSVLTLERNVGYGRANNIGVKHASSENLILLNSDIIPVSSNWADTLTSTLKRESVGIVGTRLFFEDKSLQHDGMAPMHIPEYPGILFNDHPRKGEPPTPATGTKILEECPLLTAACIALKKSDFESVGGFDPDYILGDFEDSDLCLKILESGKTNLIHRDLEIYHLERQSQNLVEPGDWKHKLTIYNALIYNQRWSTTILQKFPEFMQVKNS